MNELHKDFLNYKKQKQLKIFSKGSERECIITPQKPYVYLRHIKPANIQSVKFFAHRTQARVQLSKKFKEHNISVAEVVGGFSDNGHFVEVQKKANGNVFAFNNIGSAIKQFNLMPQLTNKSKKAKLQVVESAIVKYNLEMQKTLSQAPLEHYAKLLSDYIKLKKYFNIENIDNNSENILYDENAGFTFIDLDVTPSNELNNEFDVFWNALQPICDADGFYKTDEDIKSHLSLNKQILINFIKAAKVNKLDFTPDEINNIKEFVKDNSLPADYSQILKHVNKLNLIFGRSK